MNKKIVKRIIITIITLIFLAGGIYYVYHYLITHAFDPNGFFRPLPSGKKVLIMNIKEEKIKEVRNGKVNFCLSKNLITQKEANELLK